MPFFTIGDLAAELGAPVHQIQYVIKSRQIKHLRRAGNLRVFSPEHRDAIRRELEIIARRREYAAQ